MKIVIVQNEIEEAISNYISKMVNIPEGKKIHLEITAGRGANGISCEITFEDESSEPEEVKQEEPAAPTERKSMFGTAEQAVEKSLKKTEEEMTAEASAPFTEQPKKKSFFADMQV